MILGNTSGGGTKLPGLYGVHEALHKRDVRFDHLTGISAGAILALVIALGKFTKENRKLVTSFTNDMFFDKKPINKKGKPTLSAISRVLRGAVGLGSQNNLQKTLSSVITEEDFKRYKNEIHTEVYLGTVNFTDGSRDYFKVRDLEYDEYLSAVEASSNIPIFIEPEIQGENYLYDGGVRAHIGTIWLLEKAGIDLTKVTECFSVFSRPEDYIPENTKWKPRNLLDVVERTFEIMNIEISKRDEEMSDAICKKHDIEHHKFFLPRIMKSVYDTDPDRLFELYRAGYRRGLAYNN